MKIKIKRLAIIPARSGSNRIKNKNIKIFNNKPMISHILEKLLKSKLFTKIHVSTNSKKISKISEKLGIKTDFYRPEKLSDDHTSLIEVSKFVYKKYLSLKQQFDEIWIILPCSPFITIKDLDSIVKIISSNQNKNNVITVSEYITPIEWAFKIDKNQKLIPVKKVNFSKRSQDLDKKFYDSGNILAFPINNFVSLRGNLVLDNLLPMIIPKFRNVDIDDESDWKYAEFLHKYINET
jgi:pseudaminic acid cytidylyltransferase